MRILYYPKKVNYNMIDYDKRSIYTNSKILLKNQKNKICIIPIIFYH